MSAVFIKKRSAELEIGPTTSKPPDDHISQEEILYQGKLKKRSCGGKSAKFSISDRYVILTKTTIFYYEKKDKKGNYTKSELTSFPVKNIKIVQDVDKTEFGTWCFQIGDKEEIMYFNAHTNFLRDEWKENIRKAAKMLSNVMLEAYHPKAYSYGKSAKWNCCGKIQRNSDGCQHVVDHTFRPISLNLPSKSVDMLCQRRLRSYSEHSEWRVAIDGFFTPTKNIYLTPESKCKCNCDSANSPKIRDSGVYCLDEITSNFEGSYEKGRLYANNSDGNGRKLQEEEIQNLCILHDKNYESPISITKFIDADKLALATKEKVFLIECGRNIRVHSDNVKVKSLSSWGNMIVMATEETVMHMNVDKPAKMTLSSLLDCVEFTPDGTSVLGSKCDVENYSIERWTISSNTASLAGSIGLTGKPIKFWVHPDPRLPLVVVLAEDKTSQKFHLIVYNYESYQPHQDKICFEASEHLHAVFSSEDKSLILAYGKALAIADLKLATVTHLKELDVREDISSIGISPTGMEMVLGLTNGTITIVNKEDHKWVAKCSTNIETGAQITAVDYSYDDSLIAVATSSGNLKILGKEKDPLSFFHPSEELPLDTITIPQSGGHKKLQDDISIDFPPGFTESSSGMSFQYGVFSPYELGPCVLPEGMSLVSAILALHPASHHTTFEKGIKITMPHFYRLETAEDCSKIKVLKAELGDYEITEEGKVLKFKEVSNQKEVSLFTRLEEVEGCGQVGVSYAEYSTLHCCFYCIVRRVRKEETENVDFCLTQFKPKSKSLGNSDEFLVQYTLSYFLPTCQQNLEDQYPKTEYDRTMRIVQFKEQNGAIEIKLKNDAQRMETRGWIAEVSKGQPIWKCDVYFWKFPKSTVQWMCEEKIHPPGFTIKISTTEYKCSNIDLTVAFTGLVSAKSSNRCEGGATIDYTVELKSSDVCPETAQERMVVLSPAEILNSSRSYEAIAAQKCTQRIAEGVDSPDKFLMALFSKLLLTREEVESLRIGLQSAPLDDREERVKKNFDIMLKVHRKISEDSHLFFCLCDALEDICCFRFKKLLFDTLKIR